MIIDSPIISGSAAASGSLNQLGNITITGSLTVTGAIIGALTGSVNSASYAANAELLDGLDSTVFTLTSSFAAQTASFTAFTSSILAQTASLLSFTASTILNDATQSARLSGLEAASASINSYTSSIDAKIVSIYSTTSSLNASVASLNSYTQSNDANIASIYTTTASLNSFSASVLSYTASQNITNGTFTTTASFNAQTASFTAFTSSINAFSASILSFTSSQNITNGTFTLTSSFAAQTASFTAFTSSINAFSASINSFSASILTFTGSAATRLGALEAATASLYTATSSLNASVASLNSYTQSTDAKIASIYSTTSSLNTRVGTLEAYTSSLNNKTSSFATTGSNIFIGTQTITGSINQSGSFTSTGTITAQTLVVQTITSSVIYSSGSNVFGNAIGNTQIFTGSLSVTGSTAYFAGNVGIGSTSPAYKLDVNGSIKTQATGAGTGILLHTNTGWTINSNLAQFWTGQTSGFAFQLNSTGDGTNEKVRIDGSGNVGIGTTAPSYALDVQSSGSYAANFQQTTSNTYGVIRVTGNNRGSEIDFYSGSTALGSIWADSSIGGNMHFGLGSGFSEKMFISGSGNVGIGTTSPSAKLDVNGAIMTEDSFVGRYSTALPSTSTNGFFKLDTNFVDGNNGGLTISSLTANAYQPRMTINYLGNVGIGTTSPGARLDVTGTGDTSEFASLTLRAGNSATLFTSNQIRLGYSGTSDYSHAIKTRHHSGDYTNAIDFYVWKYGTNAAGTIGTQHVMTLTQGITGVDGSGRVGIGTTSPGYKLDINGTLHTAGQSNLGGGGFYASTDQTFVTSVAYAFRDAVGINNPNSVSFAVSANTVMSIGSMTSGTSLITTGNVGIGTTAPTAKLDIQGGSDGDGMISMGSNSVSGILNSPANIYINADSDNNSASGTIGFGFNRTGYTGGTEAMRILESGNVGIGTTSPGTKLNIYSDTTADGILVDILSRPRITLRDRGNSDTIIGTGDYGLDDFFIDTYSGNALAIKGSTRNVGIGTTSPGTTLQVAGTISPSANGTYDLGTSSLRWSTVYTSDLSLSNGIGDYTIVEGENDLFLYNNKQNKVYKFMLAEVDPTDATPKKS